MNWSKSKRIQSRKGWAKSKDNKGRKGDRSVIKEKLEWNKENRELLLPINKIRIRIKNRIRKKMGRIT